MIQEKIYFIYYNKIYDSFGVVMYVVIKIYIFNWLKKLLGS